MESFLSELENPLVQKDIIELGQKIAAYQNGTLNEDKFKALRLARGVYGQRQAGVQMIRIKLPFGKFTAQQLRRIAAVSDEYSTGNLHITTRQDVQIHFVSLDRTPQLWAELEKDDVTLREACGNTVRNVTASSIAGIDKDEPFDVSPYADLVFRYFLRKPFGQELGRKIKIAFSSNDADDAYSFIHDFGFIPKIQNEIKGFKVLVGGGLGAQPFLAKVAYEFLPDTELIPFLEASIRVFDRHGERNSRHKARIKYLIGKVGIEGFLDLVEAERKAVQYTPEDFILNPVSVSYPEQEAITKEQLLATIEDAQLKKWIQTNVIEQKQTGYFGVFVKVLIGNFNTDQARKFADIVEKYTSNDARFTIDQSILLKFVKPSDIINLYADLKAINLHHAGYNSTADVTACPGTDTCNLGISDSTHVAKVIEQTIADEYPELFFNKEIKIKISGCINSCGQHGLAHIGLHGSSMKVNGLTAPALQLLLGGGSLGDGAGRIADKVIKFPSKRVLQVLRAIFDDYSANQLDEETFLGYYDRQGNKYFYDLLKPLADNTNLQADDFIDWGQTAQFKTEIGVGECAGVLIDLVATLFFDAEEKLDLAQTSIQENRFADAIYQTYAAGIHTAKALLLDKKVHCNTQAGIINDFDSNLTGIFQFESSDSFQDFILQINKNEPTALFAQSYFERMRRFVNEAVAYRKETLEVRD